MNATEENVSPFGANAIQPAQPSPRQIFLIESFEDSEGRLIRTRREVIVDDPTDPLCAIRVVNPPVFIGAMVLTIQQNGQVRQIPANFPIGAATIAEAFDKFNEMAEKCRTNVNAQVRQQMLAQSLANPGVIPPPPRGHSPFRR